MLLVLCQYPRGSPDFPFGWQAQEVAGRALRVKNNLIANLESSVLETKVNCLHLSKIASWPYFSARAQMQYAAEVQALQESLAVHGPSVLISFSQISPVSIATRNAPSIIS
jgi:hypothetical protein